MREPGQADCLEIVNGPEDGAEYAIVRAPFHIGSDPLCTVAISMDYTVRARHALLSAVSDGYRVRRLTQSPVLVDGRPAGMFRSRIVRDGGYVQVGRTMLALECAPDGLACRSRGIVTESDLGWAVKQGLKGLRRLGHDIASAVLWLLARILRAWWLWLGLAVILFIVSDTFRWYVKLAWWQTFGRLTPYLGQIWDAIVH